MYVHATFLFLPLIFLLYKGVASMLLVLVIFACVLLHEFGHALTAKRFGVLTRDITLLPIGGLARLEKIPREPRQELLIALAGPGVNVGIAALLFPLSLAAGWGPISDILTGEIAMTGQVLVESLVLINMMLATFNIIPAFPMDGGRVLRALLALKLDYVKATRIAVVVGQVLAIAFGLFGILNEHFLLVLIAFFIYLGAAHEGAIAQYRESFQGLPASCAMITNFRVLDETDRLETAVEYLLLGTQVDFPVMREQEVVGMLTRAVLIDSLRKKGPYVTLSSLPLKEVTPLEDDLPLDLAFEALQEQGVQSLPVMRRGQLVGLINMENLAEFSMVQAAMRRRPEGRISNCL